MDTSDSVPPEAAAVEPQKRSCTVGVQSHDGDIHSNDAHNSVAGTAGPVPGSRRNRTSSGPPVSAGQKRKRHRRRGRAKRRYKPYMKLTYTEKRELEDREERRAENVRRERFRSGIPVAPYNTTQFLLEDRQARTEHQRDDVDDILIQLKNSRHHRSTTSRNRSESTHTDDGSGTDSSLSSSLSEDDFEDYVQKEFSADYTSAHAERLEEMSKPDLVQDYLDLEQLLEKTQAQLAETKKKNIELQCQNADLRSDLDDLKANCKCGIAGCLSVHGKLPDRATASTPPPSAPSPSARPAAPSAPSPQPENTEMKDAEQHPQPEDAKQQPQPGNAKQHPQPEVPEDMKHPSQPESKPESSEISSVDDHV